MFVSLAVSLISALVIVPLLRFYMKPLFGVYLLAVYVAFLLIAVLVETAVI